MRFPAAALLLASTFVGFAGLAQAGTAYKVLGEESNAQRRTISIRLDQRISDAELASIAHAVKTQGRAQVPRTVVNFFLPGMRLTDSAWASASFGPELKITISGLSVQEVESLTAELVAERRDLVGAWLTGAPALPGRIVIFREKNRLYAEWRVRGGHVTVDEVVESRSSLGRRFDIPGDDSQYYLIGWSGALELRDKKTVIAVAERLSLSKDAVPSRQVRAPGGVAVTTGERATAVVAKTPGGVPVTPASGKPDLPASAVEAPPPAASGIVHSPDSVIITNPNSGQPTADVPPAPAAIATAPAQPLPQTEKAKPSRRATSSRGAKIASPFDDWFK